MKSLLVGLLGAALLAVPIAAAADNSRAELARIALRTSDLGAGWRQRTQFCTNLQHGCADCHAAALYHADYSAPDYGGQSGTALTEQIYALGSTTAAARAFKCLTPYWVSMSRRTLGVPAKHETGEQAAVWFLVSRYVVNLSVVHPGLVTVSDAFPYSKLAIRRILTGHA